MSWLTMLSTASQMAAQAYATSQQRKAAAEREGVARLAGPEAIRQGELEAQDRLIEGRRAYSAHLARIGASGADVGAPSPLMVGLQTLAMSKQDADRVRYKAKMRAWGYDLEANQAKQEGKTALISGILGMGSIAAAGAVKAYGPKTVRYVTSME